MANSTIHSYVFHVCSLIQHEFDQLVDDPSHRMQSHPMNAETNNPRQNKPVSVRFLLRG